MPKHIVTPEKSQYELERDERIKRNEEFLKSLGLGDDGSAKLKVPKKKLSLPRQPRKRVPPGERRVSPRLAGGASPVARLSYDETDWDESPRPRKKQRRGSGKKQYETLTQEQRARLGEWDMEAFEEFLCTEHPISDDNRRQVMRQATKLVSGQGVHYASAAYGWPDDVVFRKDQPVLLTDCIVDIIMAARDFEEEHGRDHGNGWLLNHPLRKLLIYQRHIDVQMRDKEG